MLENLDSICCGEVDAPEFVNLLLNRNLNEYDPKDPAIAKLVNMNIHLLENPGCGCSDRIISLLEEYHHGNSKFDKTYWIGNLSFIEDHIRIAYGKEYVQKLASLRALSYFYQKYNKGS